MQAYNRTEQAIHQLCQSLAKFGRSFSTAKEDDSHTNLQFDLLGEKVWARWALLGDQAYSLALSLSDQHFILYDKDYREVASFAATGKTQAVLEQEIAQYLSRQLGADGSSFLRELHYALPDYDTKTKKIQAWDQDCLGQWMRYRQLASQACNLLAAHFNRAAEVRIWPHHFDTGVYMEANAKTGIGFGLAIADTMLAEAYFYYSVYGLNGKDIDYTSAAPLPVGRWIINEYWKGAVLPVKATDWFGIQAFLKATTHWTIAN